MLTRDDSDGRTDPVGIEGMLVEVIACVVHVVGGSCWIYVTCPTILCKVRNAPRVQGKRVSGRLTSGSLCGPTEEGSSVQDAEIGRAHV